jgi:hypothetical protein
MEKCGAEETAKEIITTEVVQQEEAHPYAFHVSGPRNVSSPNWRDLISSSWSVPISILDPLLSFVNIFFCFGPLFNKFLMSDLRLGG